MKNCIIGLWFTKKKEEWGIVEKFAKICFGKEK